MLKSQNTQTGLRATCQTKTEPDSWDHPSSLKTTSVYLVCTYLVRQVSDLDLDRFRQVVDGDVPHAARHHIADQRMSSLLTLGTAETSASCGLGLDPDLVLCGLTWNRLVTLKNMKLILDMEESSPSVWATPDSSEAGRVTWANGSVRSSKWICRGGRRSSGEPRPSSPAPLGGGNPLLPEAQRCWAPRRH